MINNKKKVKIYMKLLMKIKKHLRMILKIKKINNNKKIFI